MVQPGTTLLDGCQPTQSGVTIHTPYNPTTSTEPLAGEATLPGVKLQISTLKQLS